DCAVGVDGFGPLPDSDPANDGLDTDGDGMCNVGDPDDDNDSILDPADNCPLVANPLQLDLDADTLGNACDPDADADGLVGAADCSPLDPVFNAAPAAVEALRFQDATGLELAWKPQRNGRLYAVYTFEFPAAGFQRAETCQGPASAAAGAAVPETPAPGFIRGYLVTALDACGESDGGLDSQGMARAVAGGCEDPLLDTDADGYVDLTDNCPVTPNTPQGDADGDGVGDVCDQCVGIGVVDTDADGVCDEIDNCPAAANPTQADSDGDGAGDACDFCVGVGVVDTDGDGVCDATDNCPAVANPSQINTDGDSQGDACDVCPNDPFNDIDGDGICGDVDNCPSVFNPKQRDTDGDGLGNACDPTP
ncbi:MAG: thrombospondin type 3 repeat-containing protein, partial [Acidobacteriota bacterium]